MRPAITVPSPADFGRAAGGNVRSLPHRETESALKKTRRKRGRIFFGSPSLLPLVFDFSGLFVRIIGF
jgi:hypothetical protein